MSNQDSNIQIVKEIYGAVGHGDVDAILERVTDDVDWAADVAGSAAPWYGPRAGKAGVASFFNDVNCSIDILEFTPRDFAAGDNDVHLLVDWMADRHRPRSLHDHAPLLAASPRQGRAVSRQRGQRGNRTGLRRVKLIAPLPVLGW